jgi:GT2 family glycosyltransferase
MKISIIMTYYNRKCLFKRTLKSISLSMIKDIEVIAVDDGSSAEHRIESLVNEFPFLKIIRLEKENKWYTNPCIPYNIGIKIADGDIIVLQNPECFHGGDILSYINNNLRENDYFSFSAYALTEIQTNAFESLNYENIIEESKKVVLPYNPTVYYQLGITGWFNHSIYRPSYYHFCSAITKKNLDLLGGFDERYAYGTAYEDDEFVQRIQRMGLKIIIVDDISVVHQWHTPFQYMHPNILKNRAKNQALFYNVTMNERGYKVN